MKRETFACSGVLGLSVVIASCCVAPALFLLFGVSIGALGALSIFEPVRPYGIALGGGLLVYAGVRIFRAEPAAASTDCTEDACAPGSPSRRLTHWLFWMASAVYVVAVAYPTVLGAFYG